MNIEHGIFGVVAFVSVLSLMIWAAVGNSATARTVYKLILGMIFMGAAGTLLTIIFLVAAKG